MHTHLHICVYICMCAYAGMYTCRHTYILSCTHTCAHTRERERLGGSINPSSIKFPLGQEFHLLLADMTKDLIESFRPHVTISPFIPDKRLENMSSLPSVLASHPPGQIQD